MQILRSIGDCPFATKGTNALSKYDTSHGGQHHKLQSSGVMQRLAVMELVHRNYQSTNMYGLPLNMHELVCGAQN